jgi:endonuclease-3
MAEMIARLRDEYGHRTLRRRLPALDELVMTILSQNTSDVNTGRAFASLRDRFPTWEGLAAAPEGDVVEAIRSGGLALQKAPRIQGAVRAVLSGEAPGDAELRAMEPADALAALTALPGVGPKTASCVLLFSLGVPVMPVDTHVHRVCTRLGLLAPRTGADAAHAVLTEMTPDEDMLEAHLLLIAHGRETCRARRPACGRCPLLDGCPTGRALLGAAP